MTNAKPLGSKSYGHIPPLPGSRIGPGDHKCHSGQEQIATIKARDRHDTIIVQEKLDGSNVGVARSTAGRHSVWKRRWRRSTFTAFTAHSTPWKARCGGWNATS